MPAFRAFVSVEVAPVPELADALAALAIADPALKIVDADALHLTLAFLGDVSPAQAALAREACEEAAQATAPFRVEFRGLRTFGGRVFWVGTSFGEPELVALAAAVRRGLAARGVLFDANAFRAHVTLARAREGRAPSAALAAHVARNEATPLGARDVREIRLLRSDLTPQGPRYSLVAALPLSIPRGPTVRGG
ncbi:MAG: RNA 2',3'-cyclic phosphodiesterase [Thermoplasmatota archaeon]